MGKRVTIDNLPQAIDEILAEYEGQVYENLDEITQRIGQKGVSAVKASTKKAKFKGQKYVSGWAMQAYKNRVYTTVVIYNKKQAGLTHLLENGHVKANGTGRYGMWEGREHIEPVEQKLIAEYESEVTTQL